MCGHDSVTYTSVCALQKHECKTRRFIGLNHFGECEVPPNRPAPNPLGDELRDPFAVQLRHLQISRAKQRNPSLDQLNNLTNVTGLGEAAMNTSAFNESSFNSSAQQTNSSQKDGADFSPVSLNSFVFAEGINFVTSTLNHS